MRRRLTNGSGRRGWAKRLRLAALGTVAGLLAASFGGVASAATPTPTPVIGTIYACVSNSSGTVQYLSSTPVVCGNNQTPVSFVSGGGATGPVGPVGPTGPTGPTGATGATGPTGAKDRKSVV